MFNGVDTHEGTETKYWEMAVQRVRRYSRKAPAAVPSRPEASNTNGTKRRGWLSTSAPRKGRNLFDDKRLPGVARECGILLVGIIVMAAALTTRSPIDRRVRGGDDGGGGLR